MLARQYDAYILNLNQIVLNALINSSSKAAQKARQLCLEIGERIAQEKLIEMQSQRFDDMVDCAKVNEENIDLGAGESLDTAKQG